MKKKDKLIGINSKMKQQETIPMAIDNDTLFTFVDNFICGFESWYEDYMLTDNKSKRRRRGQLKLSELITILLAYHQSGMACFQYFYIDFMRNRRHLFPNFVSYSRFVCLIKRAFPVLICMMKSVEGEVTKYLFIDSTSIAVCHNLRINLHQVIRGLAEHAHTSTGWF